MSFRDIGLLLLVAGASAALAPMACATSVQGTDATGAGGGDGTTSSGETTGSAGGGVPDAGTDSGPSGPCTSAAECAAFGDACNEGACINGECAKLATNELGACDDGLGCTQNDSCHEGVCVGGTEKFCPSSGACMVGSCDMLTDECTEVPGNNGAACIDNDPCTLSGSCDGGVCMPGQLTDCSFLDGVCSVGSCDPQLGCVALPVNDGTPCNDNKFCTINDVCNSAVCAGVPNTCAPPGDVCMIGTCNEAAQSCVAVPGNDGAACDDGNQCTAGESCSNGTCLGGQPANNGVPCDDANGCTGGTTCSNGTCTNATSQIVACTDGDSCCPPGCVADADCLYWASGVQLNVPVGSLTGWTQCYSDTYDDFNTPMSQILAQCDKANLLLACRPVGAPTYSTLAMAPRVDVLFDCGQQTDCKKLSNGVGWYYSDSYSWGYAPGGEAVSRNSCDTQSTQNPDRLCWHSGGGLINGGWRCGSTTGLNGDAGWERVVYEAD